MQLDLAAFLAADFPGRIRLTNRARATRLWSPQLAEVWIDVLSCLSATGQDNTPLGRQLTRELIALAPDTQAAERRYRHWIGDEGRRASQAPDGIVHLVVSCEKNRSKAIAHCEKLSEHLRPIYVLLGGGGGGGAAEATFDGPFLMVPAEDNYENLLWKILESLVAVRRRFGPVGVLKIDDDTRSAAVPQQDRIAELVATTQYAGFVVGRADFDRCWHVGKCERRSDEPYQRRFRGAWAGGPLYYLGPKAVEALVREYLFFPGEFEGELFEDKAIGDVLRAHGIAPTEFDLQQAFGIDVPYESTPPQLGPLTVKWDQDEAAGA
jgi:hypothetical protein